MLYPSIQPAYLFTEGWLAQNHHFECVHIQNSTLAGGVVMGVAAGLDMTPPTPIGVGFVIGIISVLGFKFLTPRLSRIGVQVVSYSSAQSLNKN